MHARTCTCIITWQTGNARRFITSTTSHTNVRRSPPLLTGRRRGGQLVILRTNRYSENCWPCTPPPVLPATVKPELSSRVMACTLLSLQYPFNGNRTRCRESTGVQDTAGRPADGSSAEWPVSGNTSSSTAWSPDSITRSPRSGLTWTDTHSYWSLTPDWLLLDRLSPLLASQPFVRPPPPPPLQHFIRSRFRFSSCLHMAETTVRKPLSDNIPFATHWNDPENNFATYRIVFNRSELQFWKIQFSIE